MPKNPRDFRQNVVAFLAEKDLKIRQKGRAPSTDHKRSHGLWVKRDTSLAKWTGEREAKDIDKLGREKPPPTRV